MKRMKVAATEAPAGLIEPGAAEARRFFRAEAGRTRKGARGWRVVGGGWEARAAGDYVSRRDFEYWEIEYTAGGRGWLELAGRREALAAGTVHAVAPDMRRGRRSDAHRPLRRYYLWIAGEGAEAAVRAAGLGGGVVREAEAPGEVRELFEWLLREGERPGAAAGAATGHLARLLLLKLGAGTRERRAGAVGRKGEAGDSARTSFERCRALIDAEAGRLRNTAEAAGAAGLRSETVCRLFRRFLDTTPGAYLRGRRMRLAGERLREPGARVKEVAAELGFADAFHFSRVFKAEHGVSPRVWRAGA